MEFSEADAPWQAVPPWAAYLIRSGFTWGDRQDRRRIGIISMPCDSAGAGLFLLGAIRYRLTLAHASDALSHFERIESLAGRRGVEVFLRHRSIKGRFRLDGRDARGWVWARHEKPPKGPEQSGPPRVSIHSGTSGEWRLEQEAPAETVQGGGIPFGQFYEGLLEGETPALTANLARSDSAICLAGRATGESVSRSALSAVRFRCQSQIVDLGSLLAVHEWLPNTVSRATFFNSRTMRLDRNAGFTNLVVADGDVAFLRAVDAADFKQSDVVGVIHRTVERDRLEAIGTALASRSQWYLPDRETLSGGRPPAGVTVSALRRRSA